MTYAKMPRASAWLLLVLAASLTACAHTCPPPTPPVVIKPADIPPPAAELMIEPRPSEEYSNNARADMQDWLKRLEGSPVR